jgi:L-rhamnose mutarotase
LLGSKGLFSTSDSCSIDLYSIFLLWANDFFHAYLEAQEQAQEQKQIHAR